MHKYPLSGLREKREDISILRLFDGVNIPTSTLAQKTGKNETPTVRVRQRDQGSGALA